MHDPVRPVAPRLLLAALLSVTACGGPTSSAAPSTSPAPAAGAPGPLEDSTVTEDDDGRQLVLEPGDEVPLQLSSAWSWGAPRLTGEAVRLDPVDHLVDPGYTEWLVVAVTPGTAEVDVAGEPACAEPPACPPRTVRLTVVVG